ncbi:MAG: hypothetical protein KDD56_10370 [Bdellovibrionales bacterium]|nr:hypothetical protein [Bdellovibrionales bacterium]
MNDNKINKTELSDWEEDEKHSASFVTDGKLSDVTESDIHRVRKALHDQKQISIIKSVNRILLVFVVLALLYSEYRDGDFYKISNLFYSESIIENPKLENDKLELPSQIIEEGLVKYPFKDYLLNDSAEGQSSDKAQSSH